MSDLVIETIGLRKVFRRRGARHVAVDDLDLRVQGGGVHGFLGPNGSGKTTTIRMLLGLSRPDGGEMRLFGERVPSGLPGVIDRIGAVVEEPKFLPGFTGRKNLTLLARTIGVDRKRVAEVIDVVGLTGRERDRYKAYSLGMKQRLAIAATLLKTPDLLILDEPTNGLDPAGIREIRDMIERLGDSGVTVLLSSHILAEVQQVCHSVSIIGRGRLLASGSVADVVGSRSGSSVLVRVGSDANGMRDDLSRARQILSDARLTVQPMKDHLLVDGEADPSRITELLAGHSMYVRELTPVRADLETVFLELTGRQNGSGA